MKLNQVEMISTLLRQKIEPPALRKLNSVQLSDDNFVELPCELPNPPMTALAARLLQQLMLSGDSTQINELVESAKARFKSITACPKNFSQSFQNEGIMDCLTSTIQTTAKRTTKDPFEALTLSVELLHTKPTTYFSFMCFLRAKAILHLQSNPQRYRYVLIGNEKDVLSNYESDVRGNCLQLVLDSVDAELTINFNEAVQKYGHLSSPLKIEITSFGRKWVIKSALKGYDSKTKHINKLDSDRLSSTCNTPPPRGLALQNIVGLGILSIGTRQNIPTSRFRSCNLCGKEKKERFCQCRKFRNAGKQNQNNA